MKTLSAVGLAIVAIVLLFSLWSANYGSTKRNQNHERQEEASAESGGVLLPAKKIHVDFGPTWSTYYSIPGQMDYVFEDATSSYCAENSAKEEVCSQYTEDVDFPTRDGKANRLVKFKSRDGKSKGTLTIVCYKK